MTDATLASGAVRRCAERPRVDVLAAEVEEMRQRGYEVVLHDLTTGLGPITPLCPFEVIVAGELIEHLERLDMLFVLARCALSEGGQLIITTPNPYAPARVRAGQLGIVWENVDHIAYAFPSGIAELCERHGLRLAEAAVTADRQPAGFVERIRRFRRFVQGRGWINAGYATSGSLDHVPVDLSPLLRLPNSWFLRRRPFLGETFVYVVVKPMSA